MVTDPKFAAEILAIARDCNSRLNDVLLRAQKQCSEWNFWLLVIQSGWRLVRYSPTSFDRFIFSTPVWLRSKFVPRFQVLTPNPSLNATSARGASPRQRAAG